MENLYCGECQIFTPATGGMGYETEDGEVAVYYADCPCCGAELSTLDDAPPEELLAIDLAVMRAIQGR